MNPYEVLGVESDATQAAIKKAFHKIAFEHHPDHGGDKDRFEQAKAAYDILTDDELKKQYDEEGFIGHTGANNTYAVAIERIANFFINSIDAMQVNNYSPFQNQDLDFVHGANQFFNNAVADAKSQITKLETRIKQYDKVINRLKTSRKKDIIKDMLQAHASNFKQNIAMHKMDIKINELAKEILRDYEFMPEGMQQQFGSRLILPGRGLF